MDPMVNLQFYQGRRVLVTGHTGFKGSWLCKILVNAGAQLTGYALPTSTSPNLFSICGVEADMNSVTGDIRDQDKLMDTFRQAAPEVVFHLAAQPLVRESYKNPVHTYETNVMGTVNLLECVRQFGGVKSVVNVTTDKVYHNKEWCWSYRENDALDGFDPYSNSKSCSELVTSSYINSFLQDQNVAVSTARAGNVIGGGDFSRDRIIPDCIRAAEKQEPILVRNPYSVRPYQHVLEPLFAYLMIAERQYGNSQLSGSYNIGPDDCDCVTTGQLAELFCKSWGDGQTWESGNEGGPHEAGVLKLNCDKIKSVLGWKPKWHVAQAVEKTVEWARVYLRGGDTQGIIQEQIAAYWKGLPEKADVSMGAVL